MRPIAATVVFLVLALVAARAQDAPGKDMPRKADLQHGDDHLIKVRRFQANHQSHGVRFSATKGPGATVTLMLTCDRHGQEVRGVFDESRTPVWFVGVGINDRPVRFSGGRGGSTFVPVGPTFLVVGPLDEASAAAAADGTRAQLGQRE